MIKKTNYERAVEIFKPNKKGYSRWVTKEELDKEDFSWGNNGVFRHGVYRGVNKFKWEKFPPQGSIEKIRMVGFNKEDVWMQGIKDSIKKDLAEKRISRVFELFQQLNALSRHCDIIEYRGC